MRKRIPVAPQDIEVLGRPGPISKMSFLVKENWPGPKIKLSRAQEILAIGAGYRHLKELQTTALTQGEAFPAPGEISRSELIQVFAWGIHRKCGLPFVAALELAKSAGLQLLAVDKLTREAFTEAALERARSENPSRLIMMDEYHQIGRNTYDSPWTDPLLQAGAHPYSFWVDSNANAFNFNDMLKAAKGLPDELGELLGEDSSFDHIADPKDRVNAFLGEEILPHTSSSIGEAVRTKGLLPVGVSVVMLFNANGQYRGRCLRYDQLNAIVPSVHLDTMVYQDAQSILLGQPVATNIGEPSRNGAHRGATTDLSKHEYQGDESLFVVSYTSGVNISILMELADAGRTDEISIEPSKLRQLHNVVLRDPRFFTAEGPAAERMYTTHIQNENQAARPWALNCVCGEVMHYGNQVLIRDQDWIKPGEIPDHISAGIEQVFLERASDMLPIPAWVPFLNSRLKTAIRLNRKRATEELTAYEALAKALAYADRITPLDQVKDAIDTHLMNVLPKAYSPAELESVPPDEAPELIAERLALSERAQRELVDLGKQVLNYVRDLHCFTPAQVGCIALWSQGISLDDEDSWFFDPFEHENAEAKAALAAQVVIQACTLALGKPIDWTAHYSPHELIPIAHLLLKGKVEPSEVLNTLREMSNLWYRIGYCSDQINTIGRWISERKLADSDAKKRGLLSVGYPFTIRNPEEFLFDAFRESRKFGSQRAIATQSLPGFLMQKP